MVRGVQNMLHILRLPTLTLRLNFFFFFLVLRFVWRCNLLSNIAIKVTCYVLPFMWQGGLCESKPAICSFCHMTWTNCAEADLFSLPHGGDGLRKSTFAGLSFFCFITGADCGKADLSFASAHHLRGIQSTLDLFLWCSLTNESSAMVVTSVVGCVVWDANLDDRFWRLSLPCPKKSIGVVFLLTALHSEHLHVWQVPILFYWGVSDAYEFCLQVMSNRLLKKGI